MGLDTTHNCWHGAYTAYWRWRRGLMELTGKFELGDRRWDYIGPKEEWTLYAPLGYLMSHSDSDGTIPVTHQIEIAACLERLISIYPDADWGGHVGFWHEKTKQFADGLRLAHSLGEEVEYH